MPVAEKMENGCISPYTRWNVIGTILTAAITYVRHRPPHHIRPIPCSALHLVEVRDLPPVKSAIVEVAAGDNALIFPSLLAYFGHGWTSGEGRPPRS
jgi:hypothetical protein